jgi:hypothetical protein
MRVGVGNRIPLVRFNATRQGGEDPWTQYACNGADSDDETAKRHRQPDAGVTAQRAHTGGHHRGIAKRGPVPRHHGNQRFRRSRGWNFENISGLKWGRGRLLIRLSIIRTVAGFGRAAALARFLTRPAWSSDDRTRQYLPQLENQRNEQGDCGFQTHHGGESSKGDRMFQEICEIGKRVPATIGLPIPRSP